jgi:chromate transport protein ChrA
MHSHLDKAGTFGGIVAGLAAATPCCLPLLATASASLGLGFLWRYESVASWVFQGFSLLALLGVVVAFRRHKKLLPLLLMVGASVAIVGYYHALHEAALVYVGLAGLVVASVLNHRAAKQCNTCVA